MKQLIFLLLLVVLYTSCDEDSFSQTVDVDLPDHQSLPALSVEIGTGDTLLNALLTRSRGIIDEQPSEDRRTELRVLKDGVEIGSYVSSVSIAAVQGYGRFGPKLRISEPITDEEAVYRIEGDVDGIGMAFAQAQMPAPPRFQSVEFKGQAVLDPDGFRQDVITVDIEDPSGVANFYTFRPGYRRSEYRCESINNEQICDTVRYNDYLYVSTPNPLATEIEDYRLLVIPDRSFDGQTFRISLQFYGAGNRDDLFLEIASVTEDTYRYLISREAFQQAGDNPFAEPVTVHNPIENGYGYFLLANRKFVDLN